MLNNKLQRIGRSRTDRGIYFQDVRQRKSFDIAGLHNIDHFMTSSA